MILHFLTDDKFCPYVLKQFAHGDSDFVIVSDTNILKFLSVKEGIKVLHPKSEGFKQFVHDLSKYRTIILHGLFWPWQEYILENKPDCTKVAWMFWGGELYDRHDLQFYFLAPRTRLFYLWKRIKQHFKFYGRVIRKYEIPKDLFSKVDYCLTDIVDEFSFASEYLDTKMKHLWYNYYSIEDTLGGLINSSIIGDDILVGNSATIAGNHLDAFQTLSKLNTQDRRIVVPLSYGEPWLANKIKQEGRRIFREHFVPMTSFLPIEEYNRILTSCSIVIMNHYRPQALGNIITSLWLGARVYMSDKSIQFRYLKSMGIVLYSIEEDLHRSTLPEDNLPETDVLHNRSILYSLYGRESIHNRVSELISMIS